MAGEEKGGESFGVCPGGQQDRLTGQTRRWWPYSSTAELQYQDPKPIEQEETAEGKQSLSAVKEEQPGRA